MRRERIDKLLVDKGLAASRTKAQAMVMAGVVLVNEQRVEKSSELFPPESHVRVKHADDPTSRYVGRGGLKLEAALREFQVEVEGLVCLDVGASTGGFTHCILQHGAASIVAIDVGHNQIDWRLRQDQRVEVREGVNARYLTAADFDCQFDLIVVDVSFISLTKILGALVLLLKNDGRVIALIKPQFEVGRSEVGSGGIVRDAEKRERIVGEVNAFAQSVGLNVQRVIESPIHGAEGNVEFLALYLKADKS
ncbi:MAG: TlyA family rRNA (cytidine-2'-O)-methyltransferase [Blastocatellia bacterium]|nr:MAG: TlyA family rRNA (cytidine-2'-O)-methyltransferase [Blastocatellia bacterium]